MNLQNRNNFIKEFLRRKRLKIGYFKKRGKLKGIEWFLIK